MDFTQNERKNLNRMILILILQGFFGLRDNCDCDDGENIVTYHNNTPRIYFFSKILNLLSLSSDMWDPRIHISNSGVYTEYILNFI